MHYRRHGGSSTAGANETSSTADGPKQKYSVSSLIDQRDFLGAITLIDFEREVQSNKSKAGRSTSTRKDVVAEKHSTEQSEALAFCHFHLGNYQKAMAIYSDLYENVSSDPIYHLFTACCLFHLGQYEKCIKFLDQSPRNRLRNRLELHLAYAYYNDENKMLEHISKLSDSSSDQLSLAALFFHRNKFQNATDIYKKEWMKNKKLNLAIQIYVAYCFFELDRYDTSNDIIGPYLAKFGDSIIAQNLKACNNYRLYNGKVAENEIRSILDVLQITICHNPFFNIIRHNICVFRDGENALEVLPPLIHEINEARLNLCIYHLKNEEFVEAYQILSKWLKKPKSAIEYESTCFSTSEVFNFWKKCFHVLVQVTISKSLCFLGIRAMEPPTTPLFMLQFVPCFRFLCFLGTFWKRSYVAVSVKSSKAIVSSKWRSNTLN